MGPARSRLRPPIDLDRSEVPALAASCRRLSVNRFRGSVKYVMQLACAHQPARPHVRSTFESLGSVVPRLLRRHVPVSPENGTVVDWRGSAQICLYVHLHVKFAHVHDATIYTHECIYVYAYIYIYIYVHVGLTIAAPLHGASQHSLISLRRATPRTDPRHEYVYIYVHIYINTRLTLQQYSEGALRPPAMHDWGSGRVSPRPSWS